MSDNWLTCQNCAARIAPDALFCQACGKPSRTIAPPIHVQLQEDLGSDYQVMGELGRGGFAMVYSVRDTKRSRYLAVKVMRPELMTSSVMLERFHREANYVADLDHPNILSALFTSNHPELAYYAMPRVNGESLGQLQRTTERFEIEPAKRILADIARGLQHAHDRSVVHRDIKPSNIMIDEGGRALILDFGVAKALAAEGGSLTITGETVGTPRYMSPEQCAADRHIDGRTDMYSWGVLAYEMLTGAPPFDAPGAQETMNLHLTAPIPELRELRADAPRSLAAAIRRCLAKDPGKRFPTMRAAAQAAGVAP